MNCFDLGESYQRKQRSENHISKLLKGCRLRFDSRYIRSSQQLEPATLISEQTSAILWSFELEIINFISNFSFRVSYFTAVLPQGDFFFPIQEEYGRSHLILSGAHVRHASSRETAIPLRFITQSSKHHSHSPAQLTAHSHLALIKRNMRRIRLYLRCKDAR